MSLDPCLRDAESSVRLDDGLLATYYQEFRKLARRQLGRSNRQITIDPTDLAHEAAVRMLSAVSVPVRDEAHLLALSSRVIRATLIDEIRRRRAAKRDVSMLTRWDDRHEKAVAVDLEAFDRLIDRLATIDSEASEIVQLRFYAGLTMAEIAREFGRSESTVLRRWRIGRAWLLKELAVTC